MKKKNNWFIYAYPEMYGGLHGMYNYDVAYDLTYDEVCDWAFELAYETVESYLRVDEIYTEEDFMEDCYNGAEWNDCYKEEYWDTFDEVMREQCSFEVYPIKDGVTEADYIKWQKENMEPRDFIERYCRELTNEDYI